MVNFEINQACDNCNNLLFIFTPSNCYIIRLFATHRINYNWNTLGQPNPAGRLGRSSAATDAIPVGQLRLDRDKITTDVIGRYG